MARCSADNGHTTHYHIGGPFYRCVLCGQLFKDSGTGVVQVPEQALDDWRATHGR